MANLSSELKTQTTAIRGYVGTLLNGAMNKMQETEKKEVSLQKEYIGPILELAMQQNTKNVFLNTFTVVIKPKAVRTEELLLVLPL